MNVGSYPITVTHAGHALVFSIEPEDASAVADDDERYHMNLWDRRYRLSREPLVAGCSCLTCTRHTRAYVHHLLNTHEMLAHVLLMMCVHSLSISHPLLTLVLMLTLAQTQRVPLSTLCRGSESPHCR